MLFNQNFQTLYYKKKLHLNILVSKEILSVIWDFWDILQYTI